MGMINEITVREEVSVYVTSAFSKDNKGGNKAGVVLNRSDLSSAQKMKIAKMLGYSETAFVDDSCLDNK